MTGEVKTAPDSFIYKLIELYARSKNVEVTNIRLIPKNEPEKKEETVA